MATNRIKTVIDRVRGDREFFGWIAAIVIGTITTLAWMGNNFVTTVKAEEMMKDTYAADDALASEIKSLAVSVKESNALLSIHMKKGDLDVVVNKISNNRTQTFNLKQFVRVNGSDDQTDMRLQQLESDLEALKIQRGCIISHNPLCD